MDAFEFDQARDLLGVDRRASPDDIRRAYRSLARLHHPDAGGDVTTFQRLSAAADLLLDGAHRRDQAAASPSTGRRAYPSTAAGFSHDGRPAAPGDTSVLDGASVPSPGDWWSRAGVAAAVRDALAAGSATIGTGVVTGVSRGPRSLLNRFARHLSGDLLSRWEVAGASRRGRVDSDLEIVATFPPGGRKRIDRAVLPTGWSTTRNPAGTESTFVVRPGADPAATAVLSAEALDGFCDAIGWPLETWSRPA